MEGETDSNIFVAVVKFLVASGQYMVYVILRLIALILTGTFSFFFSLICYVWDIVTTPGRRFTSFISAIIRFILDEFEAAFLYILVAIILGFFGGLICSWISSFLRAIIDGPGEPPIDKGKTKAVDTPDNNDSIAEDPDGSTSDDSSSHNPIRTFTPPTPSSTHSRARFPGGSASLLGQTIHEEEDDSF